MNTCPDRYELSSFLDGECANAARVARHIQSCPDCARIHLEMRKVSADIQALEAPIVSSDFTASVLARCETAPSPTSWLGWPVGHLGFAAALLILGGVGALVWLDPFSGGSPARMATPTPTVNPTWNDDGELVAALAHLMAEGADLALFSEPDYQLEDDVPAGIPVDDMLDALADDLSDAPVEIDEPEDFAMLLDQLAGMDALSLAALLQSYESEG